MPRKAVLLNSLTRGRVRTSFNKYNLFNLYKKGNIDFRSKSLYQQKWSAKQETRAYHGEHITESRWQTMFSPKLDSVAQLDASLRGGVTKETPFLMQTFATLEKRLDFAVFRAMFASSVRQARQFILHGNVYVNGVKIKHPGYTLKPGDTFNVKPEKVLQALGSKKPSFEEALKVDKKQVVLWNKYVKEAKTNPQKAWSDKVAKFESMLDTNEKKHEFLKRLKREDTNLQNEEYKILKALTPKDILAEIISIHLKKAKDDTTPVPIEEFKTLAKYDEAILPTIHKIYETYLFSKTILLDKLKGKNKEEIKEFASSLISPKDDAKKDLIASSKTSLREGKNQLSDFVKKYSQSVINHFKNKQTDGSIANSSFDPKWAENLKYHPRLDLETIKEDEVKAREAINLPWQSRHLYGRKDSNKPYFTPWKPRPFLAPFAILPHHLEISFKTCHAVYLRDPVARPGHSEVISPFDIPVHERAYMYYIRRGK